MYASTTVLVRKKDKVGSSTDFHQCSDYCEVNQVTTLDKYPILRIEDNLYQC